MDTVKEYIQMIMEGFRQVRINETPAWIKEKESLLTVYGECIEGLSSGQDIAFFIEEEGKEARLCELLVVSCSNKCAILFDRKTSMLKTEGYTWHGTGTLGTNRDIEFVSSPTTVTNIILNGDWR